jgi:hypothetical protein
MEEVIMLIENLGWFMLGAGSMLWFVIIYNMIRSIINTRRQTSKFNAMISQLKQTSQILSEISEDANGYPYKRQLMEAVGGEYRPHFSQQISELTFRDVSGKLSTVRIIVDPGADDETPLDGNSEQFIFSPKTVERMRNAGVEPDDVVTRILRESGRIA